MATYQGTVIIALPSGTALELDASISESHDLSVEVTQWPVEQGTDMTDHKRVKPDILRINGIKSDTPILTQAELAAAGIVTSDSNGNWKPPGIVDGAYRFLRSLAASKDNVSIATKKWNYDDMALTSLSVPEGPGHEDILDFTAVFQQIRVVSNKTVQVVTRTPSGQPTQNNGKQATAQATAAQQSKTILKRFSDATGLSTSLTNLLSH